MDTINSNNQNNRFMPYALTVITGFLVCLIITLLTGRKEAWDSAWYFSVGLPVMCAVIFAISWRFPLYPWRWALSMAFGQSVAIVLGGGSLSLWPLAIIAMTIVSAPQFLTALMASKLARRRDENK
jgi:hypothetical protein